MIAEYQETPEAKERGALESELIVDEPDGTVQDDAIQDDNIQDNNDNDADRDLISRINSEAASSIASFPFTEVDDWALSVGESDAEEGWVKLDSRPESRSDFGADFPNSIEASIASLGTLGGSSPQLASSENSLRMPTFGSLQHEDLRNSTKHLFHHFGSPKPDVEVENGQLSVDNIKLRILVTGSGEQGISRFVEGLLRKSVETSNLTKRSVSPDISEWLFPLKQSVLEIDQGALSSSSRGPTVQPPSEGLENLSILEHRISTPNETVKNFRDIIESRIQETVALLKSRRVKDFEKELMHSKVSQYPLVDCCIYLFREYYPSHDDIMAIKAMAQYVDVIPVLGRTTPLLAEIDQHKATVVSHLREAGIFTTGMVKRPAVASADMADTLVYASNACGSSGSLTELDRGDIDELARLLFSPEFMKGCHERAVTRSLTSAGSLCKRSESGCCEETRPSINFDSGSLASNYKRDQICVQCHRASSVVRRQLRPIDGVDPLRLADVAGDITQTSFVTIVAIVAVSFACGVKFALVKMCPEPEPSVFAKVGDFAHTAIKHWWK